MIRWFEINPFWLVVAIMLVIVAIFQFINSSIDLIAWVGLFLGVAGFANSLWLNHRISRTQDILYKKNLAEPGDFNVSRHETEEG